MKSKIFKKLLRTQKTLRGFKGIQNKFKRISKNMKASKSGKVILNLSNYFENMKLISQQIPKYQKFIVNSIWKEFDLESSSNYKNLIYFEYHIIKF